METEVVLLSSQIRRKGKFSVNRFYGIIQKIEINTKIISKAQ
jgi:hypothetical protein